MTRVFRQHPAPVARSRANPGGAPVLQFRILDMQRELP